VERTACDVPRAKINYAKPSAASASRRVQRGAFGRSPFDALGRGELWNLTRDIYAAKTVRTLLMRTKSSCGRTKRDPRRTPMESTSAASKTFWICEAPSSRRTRLRHRPKARRIARGQSQSVACSAVQRTVSCGVWDFLGLRHKVRARMGAELRRHDLDCVTWPLC
jgi:hypothetical protein